MLGKALLVLLACAALFLSAEPARGSVHAPPMADLPDLSAGASGISAESMRGHIEAIQGPRSGLDSDAQRAKLAEVAAYIHDSFVSYGLNVSEDPVTYQGYPFPNIVGTLTGNRCPGRTIIVGAHYDGVAAGPAADDNASGVAGVLEVARALGGQQVPASVQFVTFAWEETGLNGSRQMAAEAAAAGRQIAGVIVFDMIGYTCFTPGCLPGHPDPNAIGDFILVLGNTASSPLLERFTAASSANVPELPLMPWTVPGNGESLPDSRRSDHAPFWDGGYQALLLSDFLFGRNPYYHTAEDTIDKLDLPFAANVARASLETVVAMLTADDDGNGALDICGNVPDAIGGAVEFGRGSGGVGASAIVWALVATLAALGFAWSAARRGRS